MRGVLNAGHRRGGKIFRCEGDSHEIRGFSVFGPVVLCGIGALPGTLQDRSITIRLERAKPGEIQQRFDSRHTDYERELCSKLARWCADNRARLEACDPKMPKDAFDRLADKWRPLFAIAEILGGDWPRRAAIAFDKLTSRDDSEAQGIGVMLLADSQQVFDESGIERIFSRDLIRSLCEMKERPWPEAQRGKPITERWLARHLGSFGIHPKTLRIDDDRAKGYEKADFAEAFERYAFPPEQFSRDSVTCQEKGDLGAVTIPSVVTDEKNGTDRGNVTVSRSKTPAKRHTRFT